MKTLNKWHRNLEKFVDKHLGWFLSPRHKQGKEHRYKNNEQ